MRFLRQRNERAPFGVVAVWVSPIMLHLARVNSRSPTLVQPSRGVKATRRARRRPGERFRTPESELDGWRAPGFVRAPQLDCSRAAGFVRQPQLDRSALRNPV